MLMAAFALLSAAFFHTQVVNNLAYSLQSDRNRLRPMPIPSARGTILDRNGRIVGGNRPGYAVARRKHGMRTDTIQTLREYLIAGRLTPWAVWQ